MSGLHGIILTHRQWRILMHITGLPDFTPGPNVMDYTEEEKRAVLALVEQPQLNDDDIVEISEALDSHLYWQVNDDHTRRDSGFVMPPYTEEEQFVLDLTEKVNITIGAQRQEDN